MDTLAVRLTIPPAGFVEDFHLLVNAPCRAHKGKAHLVCDSRAEAELLYTIAQTGQRGVIAVPVAETDCQRLLDSLKARLDKGEKRLEELSEMRAGTDKMREQMMVVLRRWFIQAKPEQ
jgi:hypothetical protein